MDLHFLEAVAHILRFYNFYNGIYDYYLQTRNFTESLIIFNAI